MSVPYALHGSGHLAERCGKQRESSGSGGVLPGPAVPRRRGTTRSASCLRALATGAVPVPVSWYSIRSPAGEQIAGADRFQRGETWPIFMAGVLAMLVLNLLAAAHLKRSPELFTLYLSSISFAARSLQSIRYNNKLLYDPLGSI